MQHRADGSRLYETDVARPGIYVYRNADGSIRRELVPPETLADPEWLRSLARTPVTLQHPTDSAGRPLLVTPDNAGDLMVGDADGEVEVLDDGFVRLKIAVRRRDALDAIDNGTDEVSPAYRVRVEHTSGEHPEFGAYDAVQVKRFGNNHLALCDHARGGGECRLGVDDARMDGLLSPRTDASPSSRTDTMNPILLTLAGLLSLSRLDSEEHIREDAESRIRDLRAVADDVGSINTDAGYLSANFGLDLDTEKPAISAVFEALGAALASSRAEADTLRGERDALKAAEQARKDAEQVAADAAALAELKTLAAGHLDAAVIEGAADAAALKRALATAVLSGQGITLAADAADAYLDGVLATVTPKPTPRADARYTPWSGPAATRPPATRTDAAEGPRVDAGDFFNPAMVSADEAFNAVTTGGAA